MNSLVRELELDSRLSHTVRLANQGETLRRNGEACFCIGLESVYIEESTSSSLSSPKSHRDHHRDSAFLLTSLAFTDARSGVGGRVR